MLGLSGVYAECDLSCNAIPVFIAVYTNYTDFIYVVSYIYYMVPSAMAFPQLLASTILIKFPACRHIATLLLPCDKQYDLVNLDLCECCATLIQNVHICLYVQ